MRKTTSCQYTNTQRICCRLIHIKHINMNTGNISIWMAALMKSYMADNGMLGDPLLRYRLRCQSMNIWWLYDVTVVTSEINFDPQY